MTNAPFMVPTSRSTSPFLAVTWRISTMASLSGNGWKVGSARSGPRHLRHGDGRAVRLVRHLVAQQTSFAGRGAAQHGVGGAEAADPGRVLVRGDALEPGVRVALERGIDRRVVALVDLPAHALVDRGIAEPRPDVREVHAGDVHRV